jgi:hypothetical protein
MSSTDSWTRSGQAETRACWRRRALQNRCRGPKSRGNRGVTVTRDRKCPSRKEKGPGAAGHENHCLHSVTSSCGPPSWVAWFQRVDDSDSIVSQGAGYRAESVADGGACNTPPRLRLSASPSSNLGPTQTPISQPGSDSEGVCLEHWKHVTEHAGKKAAGCLPLLFTSVLLAIFLFKKALPN